MNRADAMAMIKQDEGLNLIKYLDSEGIPTIAYGFNLIKDGARERIAALGLDYASVLAAEITLAETQADALFAVDFEDAIQDAELLVNNFSSHPDPVQSVIVNMRYQLGAVGLKKFEKFIAALERMDYCDAVVEMQDSLWAKQTPARAKRLMDIVKGYCR